MRGRFFIIFSTLLFLANFLLGVEKPLIIGKEKGEGELIQPRKFEEGPDGNIYVYDSYDAFIKVYSPDGKFIRKIGGKGEGPGEIKRADRANFGFTHDGKSLFITEYFGGHQWISVLDIKGNFEKAIHLNFKWFGVVKAESLSDGTFLVEVVLFEPPKPVEDYYHWISQDVLIRINEKGEVLKEVLKRAYVSTISMFPGGADIGNLPFIPRFLWLPLKVNRIIFTDGLSTKFSIYDLSGNKIGELQTPLPEPEKVTSKDLDKWREEKREMLMSRDRSWYETFGKVIDKYKKSIYDKKPNLYDIYSTPEGNILISGLYGNYYLIDQKGKLLSSIKYNANIKITKNFVLFGKEDEDGVLTIYCIKRKGKEAEDLKRLKDI